MNSIQLSEILSLPDLGNYKLHLACADGKGNNPLLDHLESPEAWLGWQQHRDGKNDWTRSHIFALIDFPVKADTWLFAGIFEVLQRHDDRYDVRKLDDFSHFDGRLLLNLRRPARGRAFVLENWWSSITVDQILPAKYNGETFPGFHSINHDFKTLLPIFRREKSDWKAALLNMKGVYVLTDTSTGNHYVGSASGDAGIWSRWSNYLGTGHGGNKEIDALLKQKGEDKDYALNNFKLALLEPMISSTETNMILERESYWKKVLLSRSFGLNGN